MPLQPFLPLSGRLADVLTCRLLPPVAAACRLLLQGVEAEELLVLTFSRKAQAEFQHRLRRDVPGAEAATVSTFHGWAWMVLRSHWREAGFERRPSILSSEDQQLAIMSDCLL